MFNPSPTFIAALIAFPAILAQGTNSSGAATTTAASPAASSNSTPPAPVSSAPFTPANFTPVVATSTTCGSAQQNFNQCITKVGKDISNCADNTCLCQTYANIAACYNGCAELASQGEAYQAQSTQACTAAGIKPNTTATVTPTTTNSSSSTTPNTTPIRNTTSSNPSSNASTFSAAKSAASSHSISFAAPVVGLIAILSAVFA